MNTGTTNVSSSFLVYGQTGALLMSLPVTVAGGGSTRVTIADPGASTATSWGVIDSGTGTVQGMATFELRSADGVLIRTAGVLGVEAGNGFSLPVDIAGNGFAANTAIFMANINPGSAVTLVFALVSEGGAGSPSGFDTRFVTLAPGHQIAEFVTSIWPQLIGGFKGTLVVSVQEYMARRRRRLGGRRFHSSIDRTGHNRRAASAPVVSLSRQGRRIRRRCPCASLGPQSDLRRRGIRSRAWRKSAHASGGIGEKLVEPCRRRSHQCALAVAGPA